VIRGMSNTIIKQKIDLPLLPLRDLVVFPNMVVPLLISRKKSIQSLELALRSGRGLLCVSQIDATHDGLWRVCHRL
jgi:ATP-dependent Lon protease